MKRNEALDPLSPSLRYVMFECTLIRENEIWSCSNICLQNQSALQTVFSFLARIIGDGLLLLFVPHSYTTFKTSTTTTANENISKVDK